jgi:cytochrome c553
MKNPIVIFCIGLTALLYYAMEANNPAWSGNGNLCVEDCYEETVAVEGTILEVAQAKREAKKRASPAELGKEYYAQCVACHGANGGGGVGPKLAGQSVEDITAKLSTYRDGGTLGSQSALMWSVAKPMSDKDIQNLAEFVKTL